MRGRTHLTIGMCSAMLCRRVLGLPGVLMAGIGSLLPDIDHPDSTIGRKLPIALLFNMEHRGWTHSIMGLIIFCGAIAAIDMRLIPGLALGYGLHLLADTLTPTGIAWFYPLCKRKRHVIGIRTGSKFEDVIAWTFLLMVSYAIIIFKK